MSDAPDHPLVIALDDLEHTRHAHEFVGAEHGDVPFSIILVHSQPGVGPKLHRHPYAEVFVVEAGEATFRLGEETVVVPAGHVVVGPPESPTASRTPVRASFASSPSTARRSSTRSGSPATTRPGRQSREAAEVLSRAPRQFPGPGNPGSG